MKSIGIEHLLRWAYLEELPHGEVEHRGPAAIVSSYASTNAYLELLANVDGPDVRNIYGVTPTGMDREPHPDAVAVFDAVSGLKGAMPVAPDDWMPGLGLEAHGALAREAVARALRSMMTDAPSRRGDAALRLRLRRPVISLVLRQVMCGTVPDWYGEPVQAKPVVGENGTPRWFIAEEVMMAGAFGLVAQIVEVDGFDARRRRPMPGAYQKMVLQPDPVPAIVARAEYELWHAAMAHLRAVLAPRLQSHALEPFDAPRQPWRDGPAASTLTLVLACATPRNKDADAA